MRDTLEMAREAGFAVGLGSPALEKFERLIELVRADEQKKWESQTAVEIHEAVLDEREACAKVCDDLSLSQNSEWAVGTLDCAEAIRARGEAT